VKNPAVPAVRREAEEDWDNRVTARLLSRGSRTIAIILLDNVVGSSDAATASPRIPGWSPARRRPSLWAAPRAGSVLGRMTLIQQSGPQKTEQ
jgi:hypothetical protein